MAAYGEKGLVKLISQARKNSGILF